MLEFSFVSNSYSWVFFVYLQSTGCVSGAVSWQSILHGKTKKVSVTDRGWHVPLQIAQ